MANWKRRAILGLCAIAAAALAMFVPVALLYQPMIAVVLFVGLARLLKVGSFTATIVFALLLSAVPIVMFSVVGANSSEAHLYEIFYWSIISISALPGLVAFFLLPIAIGLATYAGRRWLYLRR